MPATVRLEANSKPGIVVFDPSTLRYRIVDSDAAAQKAEATLASQSAGLRSLDQVQLPALRPAWRVMVATTMECNMACTYCYNELPARTTPNPAIARAGGTLPASDPVRLEKQIRSFIAATDENRRVAINFTGGEPLYNRSLLQGLVERTRIYAESVGREVEFGLYTNGLLMTPPFVDWAVSNSVSLAVSLDGPPLEHDRRRRTHGGQPTARRILRNIDYLAQASGDAPMRVRAVGQPGDELLLYYKYFVALGFSEIQLIQAYSETGVDERRLDEDIETLHWYRGLLVNGTILEIAPYYWYLLRLALRERSIQAFLPCDAGLYSFGIDPYGQPFPCHHFFGQPDFAYQVDSDGLPLVEARAARYLRVQDRDGCSACMARHMCGGTCYHRADTATGNYFGAVSGICEERKSMVAPMIECFDAVMRVNPQAITSLANSQLSRPKPQKAAYDCESLSEFAELIGEERI